MNTDTQAEFSVNNRTYRLLNLKTELKARDYQRLILILDDTVDDIMPLFNTMQNGKVTLTELEILAVIRTLIKKLLQTDKLFEALAYLYGANDTVDEKVKIEDMKDLTMEQIIVGITSFLSTIGGYLSAIGISTQTTEMTH